MKYYILCVLACVCVLQSVMIGRIRRTRQQHKANTESLLKGLEQYRTKDSLNAARAEALALSKRQFEAYRASDAELIKELKTKNRTLQAVTTAQAQTITRLRTTVKDSVIYRSDTVKEVLRCVDYVSPYLELHGCMDKTVFNGTIKAYDSIIIVSSIKYKRFLFWRTKRIKNRTIDIVNKNPDAKILGFEYIEIKK